MRIRLLCDLPVGKAEGMTKGREFEVIAYPAANKDQRTAHAVIVQGNVGEVKVWRREYEVIDEDSAA